MGVGDVDAEPGGRIVFIEFRIFAVLAVHSASSLTDHNVLNFCSSISSPTRSRSLLHAIRERDLALRFEVLLAFRPVLGVYAASFG